MGAVFLNDSNMYFVSTIVMKINEVHIPKIKGQSLSFMLSCLFELSTFVLCLNAGQALLPPVCVSCFVSLTLAADCLILLMDPTETEEQSFSLPTNILVFAFELLHPSSLSLAVG